MLTRTALASILISQLGVIAADAPPAFEVVVSTSTGIPVRSVFVEELDGEGRTLASTRTNEQGVGWLDDAPPGQVSIRVGRRLCGAVTVSYLTAYWLQTRRIAITYDNCSGEEWVVSNGCKLTLRMHTKEGTPISGVEFRTLDRSAVFPTGNGRSDDLGRIYVFLNWGKSIRGCLVRAGYQREKVDLDCPRGETPRRDMRILIIPDLPR